MVAVLFFDTTFTTFHYNGKRQQQREKMQMRGLQVLENDPCLFWLVDDAGGAVTARLLPLPVRRARYSR
jgi:hypothetical protein